MPQCYLKFSFIHEKRKTAHSIQYTHTHTHTQKEQRFSFAMLYTRDLYSKNKKNNFDAQLALPAYLFHSITFSAIGGGEMGILYKI